MLNDKVAQIINDQINAEIFSAYLYFSMSAQFEDMNLPGFANWMKVQAQEEMTHALKFYRFLVERGARARMLAVEAPKPAWASALEMFEDAYKHEQYVTSRINDIMTAAIEVRDYATQSMLNWFVDEQVEEEANADGIARKLKLIDNNPQGLYMLDRELATRIFVDATQTSSAT